MKTIASKKRGFKKPLTIVIPTFCNLHPDYKQDLYYKIKDSVLDFLYYPPKSWFKKIHKIIKYIPILWDDYDFDYSYIYKLLRFKLVRTYKAINEGFEVSKDKDKRLKPLARCIQLLENLIENNYNKKQMDLYHKKYPYVNDFVKDEKGNLVSKPSKDSAKKYQMLRRVMKEEGRLMNKDKRELFDLMTIHIHSWWS